MNIKEYLKPGFIIEKIGIFIKNIPSYLHTVYLFSTFFLLLIVFLTEKIYTFLTKIPFTGKIFLKFGQFWETRLSKKINTLVDKLEAGRPSEVKRLYSIQLAYRNMMLKKTRSIITILGMSVGVGAIVLLLSLGYGVEKLIVNKVARLDELKMLDISAGENTTSKLTETVYRKINNIKETLITMPVISVVGRINFNRAQTDVLVYAVSKDYLIRGINNKIIKGKPFANNNTIKSAFVPTRSGQVAGLSSEIIDASYGAKIDNGKILFNILPGSPMPIWEECSISSKLLGYTIRVQGEYEGEEYWGGDYYPFSENGRVGYDKNKNIFLGKWLKATLPLYEKKADDTLQPVYKDTGQQKIDEVCIAKRDVQILNQYNFASVLGQSTEKIVFDGSVLAASDEAIVATNSAFSDAVVVASDESGLETVSLVASDSAKKKDIETLKFEHKTDGEAVVSLGFLNLLGISLNKAVGTTFKSSFIIVKSLMPDIEGKVFTSEVEYKIIGVIDDEDNTYFYVPFEDLYELGIKNFSQFKLILKNQKDLPKIRKDIEAMGFKTTSTVDTVKQIESLFSNLRILLTILGMVALGVASLGMFNTLTVSLLERTREIGGMKAIGMVSEEVQDLFLAEAMIMGLSGGFGGLMLGSLIGWTLSMLVSIIAISQGQGFLKLNYLPPLFVLFIIICAFIVGLLTGLYPAHRAKKTSALNALRYE